MEEGLVDLSLFASGPMNDQFIIPESPTIEQQPPSSGSRWMSRHPENTVPCSQTMKPLPPIPRRRFGEFRPDPRESPRCILSRMKRIRLDHAIDSRSAYFTSQLHQQTIQERRNQASAPALTLQTSAHVSEPTSSPRPRPALPMVWLAEEEMWLVADPMDPEYGYYAPEAPYEDAPPAYTESPASQPSESDFSPVRTQFMSLMDNSPRRVSTAPAATTGSTSRCGWFGRGGEERLSPLFQEAIHGVSMAEYGDPNQPPTFQQERSWRSGSGNRMRSRLLGVSSALRADRACSPLRRELAYHS